MKRPVLILLLSWATASWAQAPEASSPPSLASAEPETVQSQGYRDGVWQSWRIINGALFPVEGSSFPEAQYSRWKDPICFNVYGLSTVAKYMVETRMKDVAAQVGAPVDRKDPCEPNVTIAFTTDPAATLQSIYKVRPWLVPALGFLRNRIRESLPVQAWYVDMIRGANGRATMNDGEGEGGYYVFNADTMSRLDSGVSTELGAVTVVVDTNAIMGMELGALADYFVVLSLAESRQGRGCKEFESIANLMQKDCAPGLTARTITRNDILLLTALYQTRDDTMQRLQAARMAGRVRRSLEGEEAEAMQNSSAGR
jgi:hypothetical protein